jgi:hypothetical protein
LLAVQDHRRAVKACDSPPLMTNQHERVSLPDAPGSSNPGSLNFINIQMKINQIDESPTIQKHLTETNNDQAPPRSSVPLLLIDGQEHGRFGPYQPFIMQWPLSVEIGPTSDFALDRAVKGGCCRGIN